MQKIYSRINWENFPSEKTAVNESNLNRMDLGLDNLDDRVIALDAAKFNTETANTLIKDWVIDEQTGVITITKLNGEKILFDLNIEKIPVNFTLSDDGIITMTTDDGEQFTANIGAMIPILTFEDSDEIAVSVSGEGVNKTYSFSVKNGSITEEKLNPTYLGEIRTQVARAEMSAKSADASEKSAVSSSALAKSYAVGGTGTRDGEDTDNARYYMEQAKAVSAVDIATTEKAGIVKPDGTTITVDEDGTLHGQSKVDEMTGATADKDGTSGTVPAPTAGQEAHILNGDGTWKSPLDNAIIAAKIQELNKAIEDATALRASLEAYGMVKLCDSSAVTDSTGLALPATEKNASIEGTLAAQIASLNTDWELIGSVVGANSVAIDSTKYGEFYISQKYETTICSRIVISLELSESKQYYIVGGYNEGTLGRQGVIGATTTAIINQYMHVNGTDNIAQTTMTVYGRR